MLRPISAITSILELLFPYFSHAVAPSIPSPMECGDLHRFSSALDLTALLQSISTASNPNS